MKLLTLFVVSCPLLASEGQTILDRVSQRARDNIRNIPRYTCEEAIERSWYAGNALERSDRIRLDVAVGSSGEMFAWHGDRSFQSGAIDDLIKNGPISSGTFSSFLINIFTPAAAKMRFTGEGTFTYAVPRSTSTFLINTDSGKVITSYEGSFSAEPSTGKLLKMQIRSDNLPREARMTRLDMQILYVTTRLGQTDLELPATVTMDVTDLKHSRTRSVTTYTNCHQFLGESVIRFDDSSPAEETAGRTPEKPFAVPKGRHLAIRILSSIQPSSAWAGDRINGELLTAFPGVAPKGTQVFGHLIRVERLEGSRPTYNIDLVFDELVIDGIAHSIHLQSTDRSQLAVADGERTISCRFHITYKSENLKNAVTHWKSESGQISRTIATPL